MHFEAGNGAGWWYNFRYIVRDCTLAPWTTIFSSRLPPSRSVIIWARLTVREVRANVFEKLAYPERANFKYFKREKITRLIRRDDDEIGTLYF